MHSAQEVDYPLLGDDLEAVVLSLDPGEGVLAEAGSMTYMQDGIRMVTTMDPSGRRGGVLGRVLGGDNR
jgi:uncharacterized protein (AIM24 family)